MSKNKVPNVWETRVHFKKGQPHAIKGMRPKQNFDIKTFEKSCLNTYKKYVLDSKLVSKLECKLTTKISTTQWKVCKGVLTYQPLFLPHSVAHISTFICFIFAKDSNFINLEVNPLEQITLLTIFFQLLLELLFKMICFPAEWIRTSTE